MNTENSHGWFDEFYPRPAGAFARETEDKAALTRHGLQKWTGALPENADRYGLTYNDHELKTETKTETDELVLIFDADSCALCQKYYNAWNDNAECKTCPIVEVTGMSCDGDHYQNGEVIKKSKSDSVYWNSRDDPKEMVDLLTRVLHALEEKEKT